MFIRRGEIYYADLGEVVGSEQGGIRPVLIVQNDVGNRVSGTTQIAPITSKNKRNLRTHVEIKANKFTGLKTDSMAMMEHVRTIDKSRLLYKVGEINNEQNDVYKAIMVLFGVPFEMVAAY